MAAGLDDWEEHYGHNLETLEQRCLFRYRPSDITELAFATVTSHSGNRVKEIVDVRLRSVKSEQVTVINFHNASDDRARAIWLDFSGHEIAYSIIEPGQNKRYRTYASHPWIVRDCKTCRRMAINQNEVRIAQFCSLVMKHSAKVIFGGQEPLDAWIRRPPALPWTVMPPVRTELRARESVRCLLLCHKRLEKGMPRCAELGVKRGRESAFAPASDESTAVTSRTSCTSFPSPNLGDIPSLLLLRVVYYMSLETPVLQTLEKGLHAAPDLSPVHLPDDIPLTEFSPDRMELADDDDFLSDSDVDTDPYATE